MSLLSILSESASIDSIPNDSMESISYSSLFNFFRYVFGNDVNPEDFNFGDFFGFVADSFLVTFILMFITFWILSICVSLGKWGNK